MRIERMALALVAMATVRIVWTAALQVVW